MTFQERMFKIETDLITETIYQLQKGNIASANWYADKLKTMGVLKNKSQKIIEEGFKEARKLLIAELELAQKNVNKGFLNSLPADKLSETVGATYNTNMINILSTYEQRAMGDITKTIPTMLRTQGQAYISALDDVMASKLISGESLNKAVKKLTTNLLNSGITSLVDKAGKNWSLEGYSNMVLRSNTRQVSTQTQFANFDEYDIDLVEISSHVGAREKCGPYQGRVFSRSGKTEGYTPLSETSYGEIDGLFGINCGHRMYPYIPGTKKTYEPYNKTENDKAYAESQEQRRLERAVRATKHDIQNSKRAIEVYTKAGDSQGLRIAQENLKEQNKLLKKRRDSLKSYTTEVGRTYRPQRTTIY